MAKIDQLKAELAQEKAMLKRFKDAGRDVLVKKVQVSITKLEDQIKKEEVGKKAKKVKKPKKAKKSKKTQMGMSLEQCLTALDETKSQLEKRRKTVEKNIKSGRAESDGALKPSASLEKEAEVIENKAKDGQKLNKKQIKKIPKDMADIAKSCVTMVESQKDGEDLIRDLINKLEKILDSIQSGRLKYLG